MLTWDLENGAAATGRDGTTPVTTTGPGSRRDFGSQELIKFLYTYIPVRTRLIYSPRGLTFFP